jgi:ubiquinol-cytochrome c reductase cytochrome b subunit
MIEHTPKTGPSAWVETRLPYAAALRAHFEAPVRVRDEPYLGALPAIITAALVFMAVSGFVLSRFYNPADAYHSIQFIDREVNSGWLIHAFHETGTTMIFGATFLSLFRALFNRQYKAPHELVWLLSIAQFSLLLLVGYLGYLLTDGAVSAASLAGGVAGAASLGGLPGALGAWWFGGPNSPGTLARLAAFHAAGALAIFVIVALYYNARKAAPLPAGRTRIGFHPYYTAQYFTAFAVFALIFAILVFFAPHLGENLANRAAANPLVVPLATTPPWYLLGITSLSSLLPGTLGGIAAVLAGLGVLFALPWLDRAAPGKPPGGMHRLLVVLLGLDIILISLAASHEPSTIAAVLVALGSIYYFLHFLVLTPLITAMEQK